MSIGKFVNVKERKFFESNHQLIIRDNVSEPVYIHIVIIIIVGIFFIIIFVDPLGVDTLQDDTVRHVYFSTYLFLFCLSLKKNIFF